MFDWSRFAYISNRDAPEVLATATAIAADSIGSPKQGHIAITENDDEIVVSYVSGTETLPSVRSV